ncbi:MAG TPA: hypothetical protein VFS40_08900 [Gemmatimonadales bacterium]|nr:hypothetical protein [Gemmatimonadales bacterium]
MTRATLMGAVAVAMVAVGGGVTACSTGTAVAAGAGAVGALYWTGRQSQATAQGTLAQLAERSRQVMTEMNITPTNTEGSPTGSEYEMHGKLNDMDITIELKDKGSNQTQVEVTAKKSEVNYERGTSEQILSAILAKSGSSTDAAGGTSSSTGSSTSTGANFNAGSTTTATPPATSGYQPMRSDSTTVTRTDSSGVAGTTTTDSMHLRTMDSTHMQTTTTDSTHVTRTDTTGAPQR